VIRYKDEENIREPSLDLKSGAMHAFKNNFRKADLNISKKIQQRKKSISPNGPIRNIKLNNSSTMNLMTINREKSTTLLNMLKKKALAPANSIVKKRRSLNKLSKSPVLE
jgi:hypothetical protein